MITKRNTLAALLVSGLTATALAVPASAQAPTPDGRGPMATCPQGAGADCPRFGDRDDRGRGGPGMHRGGRGGPGMGRGGDGMHRGRPDAPWGGQAMGPGGPGHPPMAWGYPMMVVPVMPYPGMGYAYPMMAAPMPYGTPPAASGPRGMHKGSKDRPGRRFSRDDGPRHGMRDRRGDGPRMGRGMHHGGHAMMQMMRQADANKDRKLTQDEVNAFVAEKLANGDADGNSEVSIDEFSTIWLEVTRPMMVRAFQRLDADGNGQITTEELDERFGDMVVRFDRNGDGVIDRKDRPGRMGKAHGKRFGMHDGQGRGGPRGPRHGMNRPAAAIEAPAADDTAATPAPAETETPADETTTQ